MNDRFKFKGYWYNDTLKEWQVYDEPELPPNADLHLCQCTGLKDKNGKNTDLAVDKDVYDIEFELIKEQTNE